MLQIVPMDPFAALFGHVTPKARTFFAGNLCQAADFASQQGHLHLFRRGRLTVSRSGGSNIELQDPTLLFFPRGREHSFIVGRDCGADLVCATVDMGGAEGNPIGEGLPDLIVMRLSEHPALAPVCDLLVAEGFAQGGGRQTALDRLFDYLLILIVRHVVETGEVESGVLAGLADPRLARALTAIHDTPRKAWTLEDLADIAGMSRTRFAERFRTKVGRTPIDYLTAWRMALARQLLSDGKPVKTVASQVGYDSPAAFSRVFNRITGHPPRHAAKGTGTERSAPR
jgi:AraC-like DNA-binding protein